MKLSIIIPVFNEESTIIKQLKLIQDLNLTGKKLEIIVVNDGSQDGTFTQLEHFFKKNNPKNIKLINHSNNQGKGAVIITALKSVTGDICIIQDADLEYHPNNIPKLLAIWEKNPTAIVYGSRNLNPKRQGYRHYVWGVWLLTKITNILFSSKLTDLYTCYKLIPTKVFRQLQLKQSGFEIEAEITIKLLKQGYDIIEVPINYTPRTFSEGKKISWINGLKGLYFIFQQKFNS